MNPGVKISKQKSFKYLAINLLNHRTEYQNNLDWKGSLEVIKVDPPTHQRPTPKLKHVSQGFLNILGPSSTA